ncbi:MAG TPA: hypothetical protein VMK13_06545 [Streptosporangiaceae bacterium]|nr:hypothetical protein [Streptosporangiaceae bacterium]
MTPGGTDRDVGEQLAAGRDLYTLDAAALAALSPDLILTQDLCRVRALPSGHVGKRRRGSAGECGATGGPKAEAAPGGAVGR